MAKITRTNVLEHLIEKQFNLIDKTILDALFNKNFREEWSISPEQLKKFEKYSVPLLKKVYKFNTNKARENFKWIMDNYGLKVK